MNTNDFFADAKALDKIRKTTGMELVQMSTHNRYSQLWFGRYIYKKIRSLGISNVDKVEFARHLNHPGGHTEDRWRRVISNGVPESRRTIIALLQISDALKNIFQ